MTRRRRARLAAAVERDSEHPIARAIVQERRGTWAAHSGSGAISSYSRAAASQAIVEGRTVAARRPEPARGAGIEPDPSLQAAIERAAHAGRAPSITMSKGRRALAVFAVADAVRPESREAVERLHAQHIEVVMITGDATPVAEAVAQELGIDAVFAQVLPEQKARESKELQQQGSASRWSATA